MKLQDLFESDYPGTSKANRKYQNENNKPSKWVVSVCAGPTAADVYEYEVTAWSKELATEKALALAKKAGLRSPEVSQGAVRQVKEDLQEAAFKVNAKVKIVGGPKDVIGKEGYIGEIRTDVGGKKTYTIDYDAEDGKQAKSVMLKADQIRMRK